MRDGPGRVLSRMRTLMRELLARATISIRDDLRADGCGVVCHGEVYVQGSGTILHSPLGDQSGLIGAGVLALQETLRGRGKVLA